MNKTAIRNFAIWARRKLISEITYKAGLLGISDNGISEPLPISTDNIQFFDIGTGKPTEIANEEIKQRKALVARIREKESTSDYKTAYQYVVEEVAYTWFNRLIAIRFMEVNDYLPSRVRVLSSHTQGKSEPDIVTTPFDTDMEFSAYEQDRIMQLKDENKLDELFRMLFILQCNKLNDALPGLFEKTSDYTELLLNISFTDQEGIVSRLINDISEEDFTEAVEIIGWLYQYYNEERKNEVINIYKGAVKKEDIPAATQLFTTDWVVRYMVDNSLGRYWIERNPQSKLQGKLDFFVGPKRGEIQYIDEKVYPEELTFFDPCMGSGHILVYAFDVLMEIYRESGYLDRDAAKEIVEKNIFGLDIDNRAYQLAYFAVMMKARSYNRRILVEGIKPNIYAIQESNSLKSFEHGAEQLTLDKIHIETANYLIDLFKDAKEIGSLVQVENRDYDGLDSYIDELISNGADDIFTITWLMNIQSIMPALIIQAKVLSSKYVASITNPPYLNKIDGNLKKYIRKYYKDYSYDLFSVFIYRSFLFLEEDGYCSFMTPNVWMFISSYEKLRKYIIENKHISSLIHIAKGAFYKEATVDVVSFTLKNQKSTEKGIYCRLEKFKGDMDIQKEKVLEAIANDSCDYIYAVNDTKFDKIPGSPIAYWVSDSIVQAFSKGKKIGEISSPRQGMATTNNKRFLRYWHEVEHDKIGFSYTNTEDTKSKIHRWYPYNKGGAYRKWYGNQDYVVNWFNDGQDIREYTKDAPGGRINNYEYYFNESVTWSKITSGQFSMRYIPKGFIFDVAGCSIFAKDELKQILGFANSVVARKVLESISQTLNFEVEHIKKLPIMIDSNKVKDLELLVSQCIDISKEEWDSYEISWNFKRTPLIGQKCCNGIIKDSYFRHEGYAEQKRREMKGLEESINKFLIEQYCMGEELSPNVKLKDITIYQSSFEADIKAIISYSVGCMLGRYSLDIEGLAYAGGEWDNSRYKSFLPDMDNCIPITDEEYFEDDIVGRFVEFVKVVYGKETLEENLDFIAKALGGKGDSSREVIRNYFIKDFFKDHVKTYQKRPIYWLYDSGKQNGFKALIYMHRYTADTTGIVRVDYLHKMQKIYMGEIDRMQDMIENSSHARDVAQAEKRKEKLIKQLKETKEYDEKIAHIALSRIDIDLDDGVKVNYEKAQTAQDGKKLDILAKI
jgi:type II restriction/modification system DNA methylase subunit YeeA